MYCLIPRHIPPLSILLDDLCCWNNSSMSELAKALDVDESTLWRWKKADNAPKMALMSIYWMTMWGQSQVNAKAMNDALLYAAYAAALLREVERLKDQLASVSAIGEFGSANDPMQGVVGIPPAQDQSLVFPVLEVQETRPLAHRANPTHLQRRIA